MELESVLQRLFSTFPNGWPGAGLFLARLSLGFPLLYFGVGGALEKPSSQPATMSLHLLAAAGGTLLLAGVWTPLAGVFTALAELAISVSTENPQHLFLAGLSASIAMLGPGAWSIDARLFGRRRVDIDRSGGNSRRSPRTPSS